MNYLFLRIWMPVLTVSVCLSSGSKPVSGVMTSNIFQTEAEIKASRLTGCRISNASGLHVLNKQAHELAVFFKDKTFFD